MTGINNDGRLKNAVEGVAGVDDSAWAVDDRVMEVIYGTQTIIRQSRRKHL